jgi:3-hydroxyisobutyrate dehydrogenase-like beta-hydroxyacid dehydrogenase
MRAGDRGIALLGYGEVGQVLAADLGARGATDLAAWDRLYADPASAPRQAALRQPGLVVATGLGAALAGRGLVISAVTAGECVAAAVEAATTIAPGAFYLDLNSVAPASKIEAAEAIAAAGARYVEAAVMSPIEPRRIASPILLGGPHADAFLPHAQALGFAGATVFDARLGRASAAKMCRSVMVKGMEALLTEALVAARHYGVEATVLASLGDLFPLGDWERLGAYMIARSLQHGRRRAEEMREVAHTVAAAGLVPWMSGACAQRQDWAADRGIPANPAGLPALLDALLAAARAHEAE